MTYTTLAYNGTEKTLADWGLEDESAMSKVVNLAMDTFRVGKPMANVFDDPIFPFEAQVILRAGRESGTGAPNSFAGGVIEFQGKRLLHVLEGRPDFEGVIYNFAGPWYDLQETAYQQQACWWLGPVDQTVHDLSSDVWLCYKFTPPTTFGRIHTGQQIEETLQHCLDMFEAQGMAAPFQIGTIDVAVPLAPYPMQDVKCTEVIEYCLRCSPDAGLWFDYSTLPPTANVTSGANNTPVTLALADGVGHESMRIVARPDLQARSVVLFFKQTNQFDGASWVQKTKQKYGPHGSNNALDPDGGLRVLVQTIDLQGFSMTHVYGELQTLTPANNRAFWRAVLPELQSTKVRAFALLGGLTVQDDDGNIVSLSTYPNILMDGSSICEWMTLEDGTPVTGQAVTITADATYKLYDVDATGSDPETATNGSLVEWFPRKQLSWRGVITNGVTGKYGAISESVDGDTIPAGLAQMLYTSLAGLQHEGEVTVVGREISGGVNLGNVLNLSNGRTEWAAMNAWIQSITKEYGTGRRTLVIGPQQFLSAGGLTALFLINRQRRIYSNPKARASGKSSNGDNSVTLGKHSAKENTSAGLPEKKYEAILLKDVGGALTAKIEHDPAELLQRTPALTGATRVMKPLRLHYTDASDGSAKFAVALAAPGLRGY